MSLSDSFDIFSGGGLDFATGSVPSALDSALVDAENSVFGYYPATNPGGDVVTNPVTGAFSALTPANVNPFADTGTGGVWNSIKSAVSGAVPYYPQGIEPPTNDSNGIFGGVTSANDLFSRELATNTVPGGSGAPKKSTFNPWNPLGTAISALNPFGAPQQAKPAAFPMGLLLLIGIAVAVVVLASSGGKRK